MACRGSIPLRGTLRFTRDFETCRDSTGRELGFLGRAHPLVLRAIRHGCRLPAAVAVGCADRLGLLLTFEVEIAVSHRVAFRQIIAILARRIGHRRKSVHWLAFGVAEHTTSLRRTVWDRLFASWAEPARSKSELLVAAYRVAEACDICLAIRSIETRRDRAVAALVAGESQSSLRCVFSRDRRSVW